MPTLDSIICEYEYNAICELETIKQYSQMNTHKLYIESYLDKIIIRCSECHGGWEIDGSGTCCLVKEQLEHEFISCDEIKIKYIIE
jgi:hypothetical protein